MMKFKEKKIKINKVTRVLKDNPLFIVTFQMAVSLLLCVLDIVTLRFSNNMLWIVIGITNTLLATSFYYFNVMLYELRFRDEYIKMLSDICIECSEQDIEKTIDSFWED